MPSLFPFGDFASGTASASAGATSAMVARPGFPFAARGAGAEPRPASALDEAALRAMADTFLRQSSDSLPPAMGDAAAARAAQMASGDGWRRWTAPPQERERAVVPPETIEIDD
jgi:hypothetical protein